MDWMNQLAPLHGSVDSLPSLAVIHSAWIDWLHSRQSTMRGSTGLTSPNPHPGELDTKSTQCGLNRLALLVINPRYCGFDAKPTGCGLAGSPNNNPRPVDWLAILALIHGSVDSTPNPQGVDWLAVLAIIHRLVDSTPNPRLCGLAGSPSNNPRPVDWLAILALIHGSVDSTPNPQGVD
jgi:hypothetical protein